MKSSIVGVQRFFVIIKGDSPRRVPFTMTAAGEIRRDIAGMMGFRGLLSLKIKFERIALGGRKVMEDRVTVAVDAMGGDHAPVEVVKGAVLAVQEHEDLKVILTGDEETVKKELSSYQYNQEQIEVIHAPEVITNHDHPTDAIRRKKNSSLVVAQRLVREGKADGMFSAGSTGAVLVGGQFVVGRIKGVQRAPLAPMIPTTNGYSLLIDCGANVDARPSHLVQFAQMGSIYMENVMGRKNPKVGLVNIGAEEEKGNQLVKETFPLLKECKTINFVGSVEARDIPYGTVDVIVCEAFTGNVILKLYEGLATALIKKVKDGLMSTTRSKIGGLLIKPALKSTLKDFDMSQYGGAPMLGLNGLVVKGHGSSDANEVRNAILQCMDFSKQDITGKIRASLGTMEKKSVQKEGSDDAAKEES